MFSYTYCITHTAQEAKDTNVHNSVESINKVSGCLLFVLLSAAVIQADHRHRCGDLADQSTDNSPSKSLQISGPSECIQRRRNIIPDHSPLSRRVRRPFSLRPQNVSIHSEGNEDHHSVSDGDPSERSGQSWYDSPSRVSVSSRIAETPIEQTRE
jgi:hypothetical protein